MAWPGDPRFDTQWSCSRRNPKRQALLIGRSIRLFLQNAYTFLKRRHHLHYPSAINHEPCGEHVLKVVAHVGPWLCPYTVPQDPDGVPVVFGCRYIGSLKWQPAAATLHGR